VAESDGRDARRSERVENRAPFEKQAAVMAQRGKLIALPRVPPAERQREDDLVELLDVDHPLGQAMLERGEAGAQRRESGGGRRWEYGRQRGERAALGETRKPRLLGGALEPVVEPESVDEEEKDVIEATAANWLEDRAIEHRAPRVNAEKRRNGAGNIGKRVAAVARVDELPFGAAARLAPQVADHRW
jgi:hypothetical protein